MKTLLTLLTCLFILLPNVVLSETMDDLVYRDWIVYKKFSDVPFTGKTTGKTQATFRNGERHGPYAIYYDNGQLLVKGIYKNGLKDGIWDFYYDNGQLEEKILFKNGVTVKK